MIVGPLWMAEPDAKGKLPDYATKAMTEAHDAIANELGLDQLSPRYWYTSQTLGNGDVQQWPHRYSIEAILKNYMNRKFEEKFSADLYVKHRLSVIEVAFRIRQRFVQAANENLPSEIAKAKARPTRISATAAYWESQLRDQNTKLNEGYATIVDELNERFRMEGYGLVYSNGMIHFSDDKLAEREVATPFWALIADPIWKSVDDQMKEAIDRRDKGDRTSPFHAVCALESSIKIISDVKGWTRGNEKGAANYIDNLVSQANGRFLEVWEGDMLKNMFSDVRNPFAHGPGRAPMPVLTAEQTQWSIDTSMSWIKSLIRRM